MAHEISSQFPCIGLSAIIQGTLKVASARLRAFGLGMAE
jgi:hypothetical protein